MDKLVKNRWTKISRHFRDCPHSLGDSWGVTEKTRTLIWRAPENWFLAHNGIIENYRELRRKIGYEDVRESETDTEILAKWIFPIITKAIWLKR